MTAGAVLLCTYGFTEDICHMVSLEPLFPSRSSPLSFHSLSPPLQAFHCGAPHYSSSLSTGVRKGVCVCFFLERSSATEPHQQKHYKVHNSRVSANSRVSGTKSAQTSFYTTSTPKPKVWLYALFALFWSSGCRKRGVEF